MTNMICEACKGHGVIESKAGKLRQKAVCRICDGKGLVNPAPEEPPECRLCGSYSTSDLCSACARRSDG